eukprot:1733662-Prymnesium_polylepis.1
MEVGDFVSEVKRQGGGGGWRASLAKPALSVESLRFRTRPPPRAACHGSSGMASATRETMALKRLMEDLHGEKVLRDAAQSQLDRVNELIGRVSEEVHLQGALAEPAKEDSFLEETKLVWSEQADQVFCAAVISEVSALADDIMHRWPHVSRLASQSSDAADERVSEPAV